MLRKSIALALILAASIFAVPDDEKVESLHAHPATLLVGLGGNLHLPVTWERELPVAAVSLVVQPMLRIFTHDAPKRQMPSDPAWGEIHSWDMTVRAGPRWYFNGTQHRGFYAAGILRAGLVRVDEESTADVAGTEATLYIVGTMGYLGYRWATERLSIFTDFGLGYDRVREERSGRPLRASPVMVGTTGDVNLGLGYRF